MATTFLISLQKSEQGPSQSDREDSAHAISIREDATGWEEKRDCSLKPIEAGTLMRWKKDCIDIMKFKVVNYQWYAGSAGSNFQVETF